MKFKLPLLFTLLFTWIVGGSLLYYFICCGAAGVVGSVGAATSSTAVAAAKKMGGALLLKDGSAFSAGANGHFRWPIDSYNYEAPLSGDINGALTDGSEYLKNNANKSLTITGWYRDAEVNNSAFSDLGIARANIIKGLFVSQGVNANQIQLASKKVTDVNYDQSYLYDGVDFGFNTITASGPDARLQRISSDIVGKPIILYFNTNASNLNLSQSERQKMTDILYYLDRVNASKLNIDGHTDNVGNVNYNINLAQNRADFVKDYFKSNGITLGKMNTSSFGPNRPIATNGTEQGRAKNRRVEVTLNN